MADSTVVVTGYREFLRACDRAGKDTKKAVRGTFREVGDIVKVDARDRLSGLSRKSADGYRTRVRQTGVMVEQSLRKTTGNRPDWGKTQMRKALIPALTEKENEIDAAFVAAINTVADRFERTP